MGYDLVIPASNDLSIGASKDIIVSSGFSATDPRSLANVLLWLDFSDASTVTQSLGDVSRVDDKAGGGHDVRQLSGGSQPRWGDNFINSLNVITIDSGSDDYLESINPFFTPPNSKVTFFIVAHVISPSLANAALFNHRDSVTGNIFDFFESQASGSFDYRCDFPSNADVLSTATDWKLTDAIFAITCDPSTTTYTTYVNGSQESTDATLPDVLSVSGLLEIGTGSSNRSTNVNIGEFLCVAGVEAQMLSDINGYLATKWGITL